MNLSAPKRRARISAAAILVAVLAFLAPGSPAFAQQDTSPPSLVWSSVSTESVNLFHDNPEVIVRASITDETGVDDVVTMSIENGSYGAFHHDFMTLVEGTTQDGIWESRVPVPPETAVGEYTVKLWPLTDSQGISGGFPPTTLGRVVVQNFDPDLPFVQAGAATITGNPAVGSTLTANTEAWGPGEVQLSYQWNVGNRPITGATGPTHTLTANQMHKTVSVSVTGSKSGLNSTTTTSVPTPEVEVGKVTPGTPVLTGLAQVGQTLVAHPGTWDPWPAVLTYNWYADGDWIEGARGRQLPLTAAHQGKAISVGVVAITPGYVMEFAKSEPTRPVAPPRPAFTDVPPGAWYHPSVYWLADYGITTGYSDGTFKPGQHVTRGEASAFLQRYAAPGHTGVEPAKFPDVPVNHPFFDEVHWATSTGVVLGYADGRFQPSRNITRGEAASVIYRMVGPEHIAPAESPFTDLASGQGHFEAVTWLAEQEIISGYSDGSFRPGRHISRAELAKILHLVDLAP